MKYFELETDEKSLITSFEKGELKSAKNKKAILEEFGQIAHEALNRTKNINIRLSERDLQKLKAHALKKGIPYQTLVSSVLHQYASK